MDISSGSVGISKEVSYSVWFELSPQPKTRKLDRKAKEMSVNEGDVMLSRCICF